MTRLQACLNGRRAVGAHPRLPVTPPDLCRDAVEAAAAGADTVHLHVRDRQGAESLAPDDLDAVLAPLRAARPDLPVGISTGAWIMPDEAALLAAIGRWRMLPDFASVNIGEPEAPAVMAALATRGVAIEAGLASAADAERLMALGPVPRPIRVLVEMDAGTRAQQMADAVLAVLAAANCAAPVLMHGAEATVWPFALRAVREGHALRVGFEDGFAFPDGAPAASNAALVAAAVALR